MNSPTTVLNSIRFMKNKLKNDKELLLDIKKGFSSVHQKKYKIKTIEEEVRQDSSSKNQKSKNQQTEKANMNSSVLQEKQNNQQFSFKHKRSHSIDNVNGKHKIHELKKQQKKQIQNLKKQFEKEKQQLIQSKDAQIRNIHVQYQKKIEQQSNYIYLIEDQISSPIQVESESVEKTQIINELMTRNNELITKMEKMKQQLLYFSRKYHEMNEENSICRSIADDSSRLFRASNCSRSIQQPNLQKNASRNRFKMFPNKQNIDMNNSKISQSKSKDIFQTKHHHSVNYPPPLPARQTQTNSLFLLTDEKTEEQKELQYPLETPSISRSSYLKDFDNLHDDIIEEDEGRLKTIREFVFVSRCEEETTKRTKYRDGYLSLNIS